MIAPHKNVVALRFFQRRVVFVDEGSPFDTVAMLSNVARGSYKEAAMHPDRLPRIWLLQPEAQRRSFSSSTAAAFENVLAKLKAHVASHLK